MKPEEVFTLNYELVKEEKNQQEKMVYTYSAKLKQIELNIFDNIELISWTPGTSFKDQPFNLFFKSSMKPIQLKDIESLCNTLYSTFGKDSSELGKFEGFEKTAFMEFGNWVGRTWYFDKTGKNTGGEIVRELGAFDIMVSYDASEGIDLTILQCDQLIKLLTD